VFAGEFDRCAEHASRISAKLLTGLSENPVADLIFSGYLFGTPGMG
jgi:hypothetical protein